MASIARGLASALLPGLPLRFPSIRQAISFLQKSGMGYHYQTMQHDVSTAFQFHTKRPLQEDIGFREHCPTDLFIERDWKRPERYFYYGNAFFTDPETGDQFMRSYGVYANRSMTDAEIRDMVYAIEEGEEDRYGEGWKVSGFESLARQHKWGASYEESLGLAEI